MVEENSIMENGQDMEMEGADNTVKAKSEEPQDKTSKGDNADETSAPEKQTMDAHMVMQEYVKAFDMPEQGTIVSGTVLKVQGDDVFVDIGSKSEGIVPLHEFNGEKIEENQKVDVLVVRLSDNSDNLILSKRKADTKVAWDVLHESFREKTLVKFNITKKIKGGLQAEYYDIKAFVPASQLSLRQERNLDKYIGQSMEFRIIELNKKRSNIVLSRKIMLEEKEKELIQKLFVDKKEGDLIKGTVTRTTDFGAFIDLGGVEGLLHITDMSWGHVSKASDLFKKGDEVEVLLLKLDRDNAKISLGLKQLTPEPWSVIEDKFMVGQTVKGKVKNITDFGAFVELEPGVEGLVHVSDLSWTKHVGHPSEVMQSGEEIEVKILDINTEDKKLALGIKQLTPDPWLNIGNTYTKDSFVTGTVKKIVNFGFFVALPDGIEGLVHISDMSWTKRVKNPSEMVKVGEKAEVKITEIDPDNRKIQFSLKHVQPDPWLILEDTYKPNSVVVGKVKNITKFGAFVELEEGIEGLIHISDMSWTKHVNHPSEILSEGDEVRVKILNIDTREKRISLGLKQTEPDPWDTVEERYPIDSIVEGRVKNITAFGAFVELEPGIEGLVHISEMSWTKKVANPKDMLNTGDVVKVRVLSIDNKERRIALGLKQVTADPLRKYAKNSVCTGKVKDITEFGAFVELDENVEGLVHISQISDDHVERIEDVLEVGQEVQVKILEVDEHRRKLKLSIKQAQYDQRMAEYRQFTTDQPSVSGGVSIGEKFGSLLRSANLDGREKDAEEEKAAESTEEKTVENTEEKAVENTEE